MFLSRTLFSKFRKRQGKKAGNATVRKNRLSLTLECLEDRTLMSAASFAMPILGNAPAEIRTAYGINSLFFGKTTADGSGQTIAIVAPDNDPKIIADLDAFDKAFGATSSGATLYQQYGPASRFFTVYNQKGQAINPATTSLAADLSGGWEQEVALDVEWAHALAPGARIDLIECNSAGTRDLFAGVSSAARLPGVSVVSMNWGAGETSGENASDSIFTTPAGHRGVTFLAPSGDNGAPGNYPASSPNVVAVGGTRLVLNANGSIQSEVAWSGSGGGISFNEAEPAYQLGVQKTGHRTTPDVAFDADPASGAWVYDSYNKGGFSPWVALGGTSLATPAWTGLIAIANQGRVLAGGTTLNSGANPTQSLDALYSLPGIDFHDITAGFNGTYSAVAGYDDLTGRGSPVANRLIPDLVNYQTGTHLVVTAQPPASVSPGKTFSVTIKAENKSGNVVTSYNGYVTLSLLNSPGGSTLGGTLTVKAVNGVATFKGLSLNKAGAGYELKATSGTLTPATTNAFNETTTPVPRMMPLANTIVRAMDEYDTGYDSSYYEYDNSYSGYDNSYSGYDSSYSGYNNSYSGYDSSYSNYNSYANNYQSFQIPPSPLQYGGVGTGLSLLATMYGAGAVMGGAMVAAPLMLGASEPLLYSLGYTGYQAWQSPWGQAAWGYYTPTNEAPSSFYQGLGSIGSYLPFETNAW